MARSSTIRFRTGQQSLVDVNVWLSLVVRSHEHNRLAREWFDSLRAGEAGMCRFAQLGLMRLLGNRTVMGGQALSGAAAWQLIEELMEDERVEFVEEPRDLDGIFGGQLRYPVPTVKLTGDAYMAAFAMALERKMVTFDRGFRQFAGLDVEVLGEV